MHQWLMIFDPRELDSFERITTATLRHQLHNKCRGGRGEPQMHFVTNGVPYGEEAINIWYVKGPLRETDSQVSLKNIS